MNYRYYKNPSPYFGFQIWKPGTTSKESWTLDIYFNKHVFVFFRGK